MIDAMVLGYLFINTGCANYMMMTDEWIMNMYNNMDRDSIKKLFSDWNE